VQKNKNKQTKKSTENTLLPQKDEKTPQYYGFCFKEMIVYIAEKM